MTFLFKFLHILFAAAWFGHKLLIPQDIKASAATGDARAHGLIDRLRRAQNLGIVTGLGTLGFGTALLFEVGADQVDLGVWLGSGLVLAAIGLGATVARPASRRLAMAVAEGNRGDAAAAGVRLGQVLRAESLLWVGALVAMILP